MRCAVCSGAVDENTMDAEGWIRHELSVRELAGTGRDELRTVRQTSDWVCSIDCELRYLKSLYVAAGGVGRDLDAIAALWTPGKS